MMINSVFLDTNIILDFLDIKRKHHQKAKRLFEKLIIEEYEVIISEDMISTIYYIHKDKPTALAFFQTILKEWSVKPYGKELILRAIAICQKNNQDLEDTLQCLSAKESNATYLVTNDKGFVDCGVMVVDYDNFL